MDKQRILKEAQKIAAKFSFWMVSGNIAHLYGNVHETPEIKYELEIKFDDNFPNTPPQLIYRDAIKELLGEIQLNGLRNWSPESSVVDVLHELKARIQEPISGGPVIIEEQDLIPIMVDDGPKIQSSPEPVSPPEVTEEYLTPDMDAYPSDYQPDYSSSDENLFIIEDSQPATPQPTIYKPPSPSPQTQASIPTQPDDSSLAAITELGLIQQEYAYDQIGHQQADINIYMTITLTKTFIIQINFVNYPEKPTISFPGEVTALLGDPNQTLEVLRKWNPKKNPHIIDLLHELERKLYFIQDIETESKKIQGEYQVDLIANSITRLKVHLLTYGFKEYLLDIDLGPYPKPPNINLTPELKQIIEIPLESLNSYKAWKEKESEPVGILRELSWLVDKNSRINFEIELLKANYKDIIFDSGAKSIRIDVKGKMKTQDLTFQFQINLPRGYPTEIPEIKVLNEFELEHDEKTKTELETHFKEFFNKWTPFSYLVDLFNLISEKIFEVSVVSCVICHKKIELADQSSAHECPHCERPYHGDCWEKTMSSFGKCGFCLRQP